MIAPLEIHVIKSEERIENDLRAGSAVKEVAEDMDAVNGKPLDEITKSDDKVTRPLRGDDRGDDSVIVRLFVLDLLLFAEQLLDDVLVVVRELLSDAGSGIFGCNAPIHPNKAVDGGLVPVVEVLFRCLDLREFLRRIVNEHRKRLFFLHGQRAFELLLDLLANRPRTVLQNVQKGFIFAMNVGNEVFRSLGQIEYRREVDDLRCSIRRCRKLNRESFQIFLFLHMTFPFLRLYRKRARIAIPPKKIAQKSPRQIAAGKVFLNECFSH